jgi:hypothetical protein
MEPHVRPNELGAQHLVPIRQWGSWRALRMAAFTSVW